MPGEGSHTMSHEDQSLSVRLLQDGLRSRYLRGIRTANLSSCPASAALGEERHSCKDKMMLAAMRKTVNGFCLLTRATPSTCLLQGGHSAIPPHGKSNYLHHSRSLFHEYGSSPYASLKYFVLRGKKNPISTLSCKDSFLERKRTSSNSVPAKSRANILLGANSALIAICTISIDPHRLFLFFEKRRVFYFYFIFSDVIYCHRYIYI